MATALLPRLTETKVAEAKADHPPMATRVAPRLTESKAAVPEAEDLAVEALAVPAVQCKEE